MHRQQDGAERRQGQGPREYEVKVTELSQDLRVADTKYKAAASKAKNEKEKLRRDLTDAQEQLEAARSSAAEAEEARQRAEQDATLAQQTAKDNYDTAKMWKDRAANAEKRPGCRLPEHKQLEQQVRDGEQRAEGLAQELAQRHEKYKVLEEEHKECAPPGTWDELRAALNRAKDGEERLPKQEAEGQELKQCVQSKERTLEDSIEELRAQVTSETE